jgi:hypothetical protein
MKGGVEAPNKVSYILFTFHDVIWFLFAQAISVIFMAVNIDVNISKQE